MKKTSELIPQLKSYFGAVIIGSYLFVENNLLKEEDIRDLDVMVPTAKRHTASNFLRDQGFITTDNIRFEHEEYDKPIDVYEIQVSTPSTISQLVTFKFNRGYSDDLKQLSMVIFNKGGNVMKSYRELQEFYNANHPTTT